MNYVITQPIENKGKHEGGRRVINSSDWLEDLINDHWDVYIFDGDLNEHKRKSAPAKRVSIKRQLII